MYGLSASTPLLSSLFQPDRANETFIVKNGTNLQPLQSSWPVVDALLQLGVGDASEAWPNLCLYETEKYSCGVRTLQPVYSLPARFTITRSYDMLTHLTLKIQPCKDGILDLENYFDTIQMVVGDLVVHSITMKTNILMAKSAKIWPKISNAQSNMKTVPVMLPPSVMPLPLVSLYYHEIQIVVTGKQTGVGIALEMEGVYLDKLNRKKLAEMDSRDLSVPIQNSPAIPFPVHMQYTSVNSITTPKNCRTSIDLRVFDLPFSGLMMTLNFPHRVPNTFAPITSAIIRMRGTELMSFDLTDMAEYCWLRAGLKKPSNDNLNLLLSLSCDGVFGQNIHKTWLVHPGHPMTLCLTTDEVLNGTSLSITLTAICFNVRRMVNGMMSLVYSGA
jgi:hypothetical protein